MLSCTQGSSVLVSQLQVALRAQPNREFSGIFASSGLLVHVPMAFPAATRTPGWRRSLSRGDEAALGGERGPL